MKEKIKNESMRTSMYLPVQFLKALSIVRDEEKMLKSHQIEVALRLFFEKYRDLLKKNGVDLWNEKR